MKRSSLYLVLVFVSFTCICAMCNKNDSGGNEPIELQHSKGFLVTIGINSIGDADSVCLRYGPGQPVTDFGKLPIENDYLQRPKHTWEIINSGTNQWWIKYNDGRYLGYELNPNPINDKDKYLIELDKTPGDRNLFVMNKSGNKFYIQPAANKNVYLKTIPSTAVPYSPKHSFVEFKESQQLWFIVP